MRFRSVTDRTVQGRNRCGRRSLWKIRFASSFTGRSRGSRSTRDHWQRERRWVLSVVQNGLIGDADVALHFLRHRFAGVQVPIEPWKVAARDVETDPMTRLEDVARLPERNL